MDKTSKFSPNFLKAMESVALVSQQTGGDKLKIEQQFRSEMLKLGWRERVQNMYRIKDKADGKFKFFRPNRSQVKFMDEKTRRDVLLKARQFGFTTFACIYAYDRALWDGWSTGIMSHQRERTEKIFDIVKNADEYFTKDWGHLWKPEKESNNSYRISWVDSKASITVGYDFKSMTIQFLHVSEAAFIEVDRLNDSLQSVPEHGEVIEESTPNGPGGLFYDHWTTWKKLGEQAPYKGHFFPWFEHYPENIEPWIERAKKFPFTLTERERDLKEAYGLSDYHLAWRRWKIQESCKNDEELFERQYPTNEEDCFLAGENQVYSRSILKYQKNFVREPSHTGHLKVDGRKVSYFADPKGLLKVWELPQVEKTYVIGADASEGIGKDAAVAYVLCRETGEYVAELRGQIPPSLFASELWKLGTFYQQAFICPEANHHGHQVIEELVRRGYSKIYRRYSVDELTNKPTLKLGFLTSTTTKIPLTEAHVSACREGKVMVRSQTLHDEMGSFIQLSSKNGRSFRREARGDNHDDAVMAACLALEMHLKLGTMQTRDVTLPDELRRSQIDPDTGCFLDVPEPTPYEYSTYEEYDAR